MSLDLNNLATEQINENTKNIDGLSTLEMLKLINMEDTKVAYAVKDEIKNIEMAVDLIVEKFKNNGRLFYVGAGTSGRIGILDASECPPTYGTSPDMVQGIIAGGTEAIFRAVEGAEDDEELGRKVIYDKKISENDVIVGITASGRTPFVLGTVREAKKNGIKTIGISNNEQSVLKTEADIAITPLVGPEVIMGSTRMKSGTAQKLVLNMLTTASMIKLGKVYGNLMVDLQPTNTKLIDRMVRIVASATGVDIKEAKKYLDKSELNAKAAIVMIKSHCDLKTAISNLNMANGVVAKAIDISVNGKTEI